MIAITVEYLNNRTRVSKVYYSEDTTIFTDINKILKDIHRYPTNKNVNVFMFNPADPIRNKVPLYNEVNIEIPKSITHNPIDIVV